MNTERIMDLCNLHMHTVFSDGKNTAEEMVSEAIRLGFQTIGFSDHSFLSFDPGWCMPYEQYAAYKSSIRSLKEKYQGTIRILTGIEQDYFSDYPAEGFDYVIGSVHYIRCGAEYVCVDFSGEKGANLIRNTCTSYFRGDIYALLECYFETAADLVRKTGADIIGHFDVFCKSNLSHPFFDPQHPRYIAAWKCAADALVSSGAVFEINLSTLLSGRYRVTHPSADIVSYLQANGAKLLYSGDSHSTEQLALFAEYMKSRQ